MSQNELREVRLFGGCVFFAFGVLLMFMAAVSMMIAQADLTDVREKALESQNAEEMAGQLTTLVANMERHSYGKQETFVDLRDRVNTTAASSDRKSLEYYREMEASRALLGATQIDVSLIPLPMGAFYSATLFLAIAALMLSPLQPIASIKRIVEVMKGQLKTFAV